jgi:hypothetical protein
MAELDKDKTVTLEGLMVSTLRKFPPSKVGGQWRFKQEMIDAWLAEHSTNES